MVTEQQLNTFINLVASGKFDEAARYGISAGASPDTIAAYVNANAGGLGLPAGFQISGANVAELAQAPSFLTGTTPAPAPAAPAPAAPAPAAPAPSATDPLAAARSAVALSTGDNRIQSIENFLKAATSAGLSTEQAGSELRKLGITLPEISRVPGLENLSPQDLAAMSGGAYTAPTGGALAAGPGTSNIDPIIAPYLEEALGRARSLFLGPGPEFFPERTYVPPSAETLEALSNLTDISRSAAPFFGEARDAFMTGLRGVEGTARGDFLSGSPYREAMVNAAIRPLTQQFGEQVLPGISSQYSAAGRYGSGAMQRAQERATEGYTRALGDVSATITGQDYARERGFQEAAMRDVGSYAGMLPSLYQGFLAPSETLARVGGMREAISAQPLAESMQRFEFGQRQPYEQLSGFLGSIYGSPLASRGATPEVTSNRSLQNIGTALSFLSGVPSAVTGAKEGYNFISGLFA
jgi:hypothetical protein